MDRQIREKPREMQGTAVTHGLEFASIFLCVAFQIKVVYDKKFSDPPSSKFTGSLVDGENGRAVRGVWRGVITQSASQGAEQ